MHIKIDDLQKKICSILCADVQLVQKQEDLLMLQTPFSFADGDLYQIYLKELPSGSLRMTDCGHTLMRLSYENDIDKLQEGSRGKVFQEILAELDVNEDNGELYLDSSSDNIGINLFRFGQAITKINDITFLNRARVESTFYGDLYDHITKIIDEDKITKDYIYSGLPHANNYPIDFKIEGKDNTPLFLFGISGRDKARLATIILEWLHRNKASFESFLVFSDQSNIPRADLARLSNVGGEQVSSLDAQEDLHRKLSRKIAA
jgi:hypothetical protein